MQYDHSITSVRFWEELGRTFHGLGRDGSIRVIVLTSALPKYFTAGLDCMLLFKILSPVSIQVVDLLFSVRHAAATLKLTSDLDPARKAREHRDTILVRQYPFFSHPCFNIRTSASKPVYLK